MNQEKIECVYPGFRTTELLDSENATHISRLYVETEAIWASLYSQQAQTHLSVFSSGHFHSPTVRVVAKCIPQRWACLAKRARALHKKKRLHVHVDAAAAQRYDTHKKN